MPLIKGVFMKVDCPYCHASSVCESTNNAADQLSNLNVLDRDVRELCQSLEVHPFIKVVMGMTLIFAVQYLKSNRRSLSLTQKSYRCEGCNKVFTVFYPFV